METRTLNKNIFMRFDENNETIVIPSGIYIHVIEPGEPGANSDEKLMAISDNPDNRPVLEFKTGCNIPDDSSPKPSATPKKIEEDALAPEAKLTTPIPQPEREPQQTGQVAQATQETPAATSTAPVISEQKPAEPVVHPTDKAVSVHFPELIAEVKSEVATQDLTDTAIVSTEREFPLEEIIIDPMFQSDSKPETTHPLQVEVSTIKADEIKHTPQQESQPNVTANITLRNVRQNEEKANQEIHEIKPVERIKKTKSSCFNCNGIAQSFNQCFVGMLDCIRSLNKKSPKMNM